MVRWRPMGKTEAIISTLGLIEIVLLVLLRRSTLRIARWEQYERERQIRTDYPMLALRAWQITAKRTLDRAKQMKPSA